MHINTGEIVLIFIEKKTFYINNNKKKTNKPILEWTRQLPKLQPLSTFITNPKSLKRGHVVIVVVSMHVEIVAVVVAIAVVGKS